MITTDMARGAMTYEKDVYTPEGKAGKIERLYVFCTPGHPLTGKGRCAMVIGADVHAWFPLTALRLTVKG